MTREQTIAALSDNAKWAFDKYPRLVNKSMLNAMLKADKIQQWEYDFIVNGTLPESV